MVWSFSFSNLYQIKFYLCVPFLRYCLYGFNDKKLILWTLKQNQLRWSGESMEGRKGKGTLKGRRRLRGRGRKKMEARKPSTVLISFLPLESCRCPWNPMKSLVWTESSIWGSIGNGSGNSDLWSDLSISWHSISGSLTRWPMLLPSLLLQNPANKDIWDTQVRFHSGVYSFQKLIRHQAELLLKFSVAWILQFLILTRTAVGCSAVSAGPAKSPQAHH